MARELIEFAEEGLKTTWGVTDLAEAIATENVRRDLIGVRQLPPDIGNLSLNEVQDTIDNLWYMRRLPPPKDGKLPPPVQKSCFERFFKNKAVTHSDELRRCLDHAKTCRNNAAHPEFRLREDGQEFFRYAVRILTLCLKPAAAKTFEGYLDELTIETSDAEFRTRASVGYKYPGEYDRDFSNANELNMTGSNLRRIAGDSSGFYFDCIRKVLFAGGTVRVLMNHPDDVACCYAFMQDPVQAKSLLEYQKMVENNLRAFCKIKQEAIKDNAPGKMLIRTIDYMLAFGLDIIYGADASKPIIYVRFYPLPKKEGGLLEERPIIKFTHSDTRWCKFFIGQFQNHWASEEEDGWAKDVPLNYC